MRRVSLGIAIALAAAALASLSPAVFATDYYVNSSAGSDLNAGTSSAAPWQSLNRLDSANLAPGDTVYLADGSNWYGQRLIADASGTASDPITYTNYGTGANPAIWGSVPLNNGSFQGVAGASGTYYVPAAAITSTWQPGAAAPSAAAPVPVTSVFENGQFLNSASLASASPLAYVENTAGSWYYQGAGSGAGLYVNAGAAIAANSPTQFTATVIGGGPNPSGAAAVYSNGNSHLTFENLTINQTAAYNAGYGFAAAGGSGVKLLNSVVTGAGKHAVGAIDTTGFLAQGDAASNFMPGQGYGGSTAYVAYSDPSGVNDTSKWVNDSANMGDNPYPAMYDHYTASAANPTPIKSVIVINMNSVNGSIGLGVAAGGTALVQGGNVVNAAVFTGGNTVVDGVTLTGAAAAIDLSGPNNVAENNIVAGASPNWEAGTDGGIVDNGQGDVVRYNTVRVVAANSALPSLTPGIGIGPQSAGAGIYANIVQTPSSILFVQASPTATLTASIFENLFDVGPGSTYIVYWPETGSPTDAAPSSQLLATNISGPADFADIASGNYALGPGSAALAVFDPTTDQYVMYDIYGNMRPLSADNLGAIQTPEPASLALAAAGLFALAMVPRRRRARLPRR